MTNSINEIEGMEVIFVIGSNTKESHPVIANKMLKAKNKGAKLIVADPRVVPLAKYADIFLNLKPGTDIALLNAMANVIISEGLADREFIASKTEDFDKFFLSIHDYTPDYAEKITGVKAMDIIRAARMYGSSKKAGIFYTMGITQHVCGTSNVFALSNLALLTGNVGHKHTGVNPLRGQNNVQGACDTGCLPNVLPGYQKLDIPEIRSRFEKKWAVTLPAKVGLKSTEILPYAITGGKVKALYIMGENPVLTDPDQHTTISALSQLDFLVVQDIFMTETSALADVVLPSACFAEKDGTFTNTERRIQRIRKAVNPPGEAKDDLQILIELSAKMGYDMPHKNPEATFKEYTQMWPAIAGITYKRLDKGGLQWPCPTTDHPGTQFLYSGGFPRGKAKFVPVALIAPADKTSDTYPLILITGRNLFQYHSASMTGRVKAIAEVAQSPYIEISKSDAVKLGIEDKDIVQVSSSRGAVKIPARVSSSVPKGIVFIPMHYPEASANILTSDACDSVSKTPEFKYSAVKVQKLITSNIEEDYKDKLIAELRTRIAQLEAELAQYKK